MPEFFREILPLVNDKALYTILKSYVDFRIGILSQFLEREKDVDRIRELQGAIAELRRFHTLREEAIESIAHQERSVYE